VVMITAGTPSAAAVDPSGLVELWLDAPVL
jgi:hypothetical protein